MHESTKIKTVSDRGNFTIMQKNLIRDPNLSCKAFKLLCIGLADSENLICKKSQLAACFKEKMCTVEGAIKELRELGYLHIVAKRTDEGKMNGHEWFWAQNPISKEEFKKMFLTEKNMGSENCTSVDQ